MFDNQISLELCRLLRPNTSKTFNVLRRGTVKTFKMAPSVRCYAYEKGISFQELFDLSQKDILITKYDIDRYIERKKIFAKQQIKSKMHSDIDKAAMQKALSDIDQMDNSVHRKVIKEIEADKEIVRFRDDNRVESFDLTEISPQCNLNITPMASALAEAENITIDELKDLNQTVDQITTNNIKEWIKLNRSSEVTVSPLAKKMIEEYHLQDIELINGSGAKGQIISLDIYKWLQSHPETIDISKTSKPQKDDNNFNISFVAQKMLSEENLSEVLKSLKGTGPKGQITSLDVLKWKQKNDNSIIESDRHENHLSDIKETELTNTNIQPKFPLNKLYTEIDISHIINGSNELIDIVLFAVCKTIKQNPGFNVKIIDNKISVSQRIHIAYNTDKKIIQDCDEIRINDLPKHRELYHADNAPTFMVVDEYCDELIIPDNIGTVLCISVPEDNEDHFRALSLIYDSRIGDIVSGAKFLTLLKNNIEKI